MIDVKKNLNLLIFAALFVIALGVALFFFFKERKAHNIVATKLESTFDDLKRLRDQGTTEKRVEEIRKAVKEVSLRFKAIHETMLDWHDKIDTMSGPLFQGYLRSQAKIVGAKAKKKIVLITEGVRFFGLKNVDESIPGRGEVPQLMKKLSSARDVVNLLIANNVLTIDSLVFKDSADLGAMGAMGRAGGRAAIEMGAGMEPGQGAGAARRSSGGGLYEKISFQVVFTATYPVMTSFLSDLVTPPSNEEDPEKRLSNFLIVRNLSIAPVDQQAGVQYEYDVPGRAAPGGRAGFRQPGAVMGPGLGAGIGRRKAGAVRRRKKKVAPEGTRFPKYNVLQVTADIDMIDFTQQFLDVLNPPRRSRRGIDRPGAGPVDPYGAGAGPAGPGGMPGGGYGMPGGRR